MPRFDTARDALFECFRNGRVWLLQFLANLFLFGLFTAWLLIPVANTLHLILNFVAGVALLAGALSLHAATLNYFSDRQPGERTPLWPPIRRALRHLIPVAICLGVLCLLWLFVDKLESFQTVFPVFVRSTFPAWLRRQVSLPTLDNLFSAGIFLARWTFVPGLLLPLLLQVADQGFPGFGKQGLSAWKQSVFSLAYWLTLLLAALLGVLATEKIMTMTPDFRTSTFHSETISLIFRLAVAYVLGLFSWLLVCSMLGRCAAAARTSSNVPGNPAA